jgi:hypothetical protein
MLIARKALCLAGVFHDLSSRPFGAFLQRCWLSSLFCLTSFLSTVHA